MKQQCKEWRREFSIQKPENWGKVNLADLPEEETSSGHIVIARYEKAGSGFKVGVSHVPDDESDDFNIEVLDDTGLFHGHSEETFERAEAATSAIIFMVNHCERYAQRRDANWEHQLEDVEGRVEDAMDSVSELQQTLERTELSISKMKHSK